MSIGGVMRTSTSGMNAQANRLSAVSENIANANTTGYKRSYTEFSSLVLPSSAGLYNSGVVQTQTRTLISEQGGLSYTTNSSSSQAIDLAISGKGYMVVGDGETGKYLTRAGSFVKNGNGDLVNAAGFILQGYPLPEGDTNGVANGYAGLVNVNLNASRLISKPSDAATLQVNLNKDSKLIDPAATSAQVAAGTHTAGTTPKNQASATTAAPVSYTAKESIVTYDNTGKEVILDVYMSKTAVGDYGATPPTEDTWEYAVFDRAKAATTGASAPFPYGTGGLLASADVKFKTDGTLSTANQTLAVTIPNGQALTLSLTSTTQKNAPFQTLSQTKANGNPPEMVDKVSVGDDGIIRAEFKSGASINLYKIPLAMVESPDNMTALPGNVFSAGLESGTVLVGFPGESGIGKLVSGALEGSTVDLASELTNMIESQRSYTANSKVFQTGSEILDVLVNLKR
ncbi:flagellar hook protein FlgE [Antarcticirhabdus aurantiaca]|uniref:Flagellar hook protein FlgE n=1 Tax=Antarcticirhabdus aurantiaca TaxID=2606717 RepID=A0ACD4NSV1_9HYPH|nr:flagellar hook protein FlgE [Antarcticirhabdus aurantiaca]WAJ29978.1 flagellar hook protein FlgE [Jeongeuplla avenae]